MRSVTPSGDLAFLSHIPQNLASGGGVYSRAVVDLLRSVWTDGAVDFVGPGTSAAPSRLACLAWALLTSQPSKAVFAARSGLASAVAQAAPHQYGAICLNSPDVLPLAERRWPDARFILVCHNIESELFRRQVSRLPAIARPLLSGDMERYDQLEDRAFRKASLIIAISDRDAETIGARHSAAKVVHIPPVFECAGRAGISASGDGKLRLGFIGRMQWWPNRDAVAWMRQTLTPLPDGREIHLFGAGSEDMTDRQAGVIGHGFVDDPEDIWRQIDVALCPMQSGGGLNIKLVEALARGTPVLTTPFGARGLGVQLSDRPGLRVLDGAKAWRTFIEGDQIAKLAQETPDPSLARHFNAETHAKRLAAALREAALLP